MASTSKLTYHLLVEQVNPEHGSDRLALVHGLSGWMKDGHSPEAMVAKGQDAIDTIDMGIEAANDLDGPGQAIPAPVRRSVSDAAQ